MRNYWISWGISLLYSIINGVIGITLVVFLYFGFGVTDIYDRILSLLVLIITLIGAVFIGYLGYKFTRRREEKINKLYYWLVNFFILVLPYIYGTWLVVSNL